MKISLGMLLSVFLFSSAVLGESLASLPFKDSEIFGPAFDETYRDLENLSASSDLVQLIVYGKTAQGRDLFAMKIQDQSRISKTSIPQVALITGATHGDEYLNIADRLPRWFADNRNLSSGLKSYLDGGNIIYVIPIFNPDGYENRTRRNTKNVDLNRDFEHKPTKTKGFTQPETKLYADFVDSELLIQNASLSISLDYHCCVGSWLYPWAYKKEDMNGGEKKRHTDMLELVKPAFGPKYYYGTYWSVLSYLAWGTSTDYFYEKYGALSYIFEGARRVEDENFDAHAEMWDIFLGELAEDSAGQKEL